MTSSPIQVGAPSPTWKGSLVSNSDPNVISNNEDTQGQSHYIYPRKYDSSYNISRYVDYNRNDLQIHYKHNDNYSFQPNDREQGLKKRRRYAPGVSKDNRQSSSKDHHHGEGKENLPSPEMFSMDECNYYHAPKYDYGAYDAQSYYAYPNDRDWYHCYPYHDGYYYRGRFQPYPYNTSETGTNIDENESYHSKTDCRGYSFIDHTYRDFSGVPPTDEDRERYNNKKKEYERRLKEQTSGSSKNGSEITTSSGDESSSSSSPSHALKKKRGRGNRASKNNESSFIGFMGTNFPARLHDLLSHDEEISDIITWLPHGRSWIVLDKTKFLSKVAPSHFQISKFESFTRQVNGWGFKRITQGPDINSYYHELFLRGMPHLIQWMKRSTSSGSGRRKIRGDPKDEPDFYSISQMYPIPDYYGENNMQVARESRYRDHVKKESSNKDENKKIIPALPSPNQTKNITLYDNSTISGSENIRSSSNVGVCTGSEDTCDKQTLLTNNNHSVNEYYSHYDIQQPNDVTQHYWKRNGSNLSERHHHTQDAKYYHSSTSSDHVPDINAKANYYHYKVHDDQYVDFKPSEGTIGDRESFCWNDTAFAREQEQQRARKHDGTKQTTSGYEAYSKAHGSPGFSAMISDDTNETNTSLLSEYNDEDKSTKKYQNGHCHIVDFRHVSPIRKLSSLPSPITRNPRSNSIDDPNLYRNMVKDLPTSPNWTWI